MLLILENEELSFSAVRRLGEALRGSREAMLVKFTNNLLIKSVKFVLLPTLIIASSLLDP